MNMKDFSKKLNSLPVYLTIIILVVNSNKIAAQICNVDRCIDVTQTIGPTITDSNCGSFQTFNASGCMTDATPEPVLTQCGANQYPTVWFKVLVDNAAVQLGTAISVAGSWNPVWAIYAGSCDSLTLVYGSINSQLPCSNSNQNNNVHTVGVLQNTDTYYIAVSAIGIIDNPNFTLSVWTTANCVSCIGEDGCNPLAIWTVQSRSSDRELNDPQFCPGEEATICINFQYDATQTGVDWFHGLIPDFGPGWDMTSFNPEEVTINPVGAVWHDEKNPSCAPRITEQMPYLCTYNDPVTGVLKLCHTGCQACPCSGPLLADSPLPGGWFWSKPGGSGCTNDCSPTSKYGIGIAVVNIYFCVQLKVKEFTDSKNCSDQRSLHFNFQTTSDGVTGCWNDPIAECKLDFAQIGPYWQVDCSISPAIIGNNDEICDQGITQIELTNADGDTGVVIEVQVLPNSNVSGEKDHYFEGGEGMIADTLINNSDTIQIITYIAQSKIPGFLCTSESDTFRVIVYPEIKVSFDPVVLCSDTVESVILNPKVTGGTGHYTGTTTPFTSGYTWSTGEITDGIEVLSIPGSTYSVTVCDDKGCCSTGETTLSKINNIIEEAKLSYTPPACDKNSVDLNIEGITIDSLKGIIFRLLDCEGNVILHDSIPYVIESNVGSFKDVKYLEKNCFILETSFMDCITWSDTLVIECINSVYNHKIFPVSILPNPTAGIFTIQNKSKNEISSVNLTNILGVSFPLQRNDVNQIDISLLPEGVYFLIIEYTDSSQSGHRVIKIR
jgi:hypothetical protein